MQIPLSTTTDTLLFVTTVLMCIKYAISAEVIRTVTINPKANPKSDAGCESRGGRCKNTYTGCEQNGMFKRGLCPGPNYFQCCIPEPEPISTLVRLPWRMCYSCQLTFHNGEYRGDEGCEDPFIPDHAMNMSAVNCSGSCGKQSIYLDDTSHTIKRYCNHHCHFLDDISGTTYKFTECCDDELCNAGTSTKYNNMQMSNDAIVWVLYMTVMIRLMMS